MVQVKEKVNIFMSHDWPTHVPRYGDTGTLLKKKPYFRGEIERDELGSPANWQILQALKPEFWFAGHLHVAFPAVVPHSNKGVLPPGDRSATSTTRFMATDKPLPRRKYVQV
jgi:lariat debranching enzyme